MAVHQITDLFLNNQKRFTEGAVATYPAKLDEGNARLGTGPQYIIANDGYHSYSIPKNAVVRNVWAYVREAFDSGTDVEIRTIVDSTPLVAGLSVDTQGTFVLLADQAGEALEFGAFFDKVDGFVAKFSQTSQNGVLQIIAEYIAVDEKSGKYVATI